MLDQVGSGFDTAPMGRDDPVANLARVAARAREMSARTRVLNDQAAAAIDAGDLVACRAMADRLATDPTCSALAERLARAGVGVSPSDRRALGGPVG
jgi:hypothetical protein